MIFHSDGAAAEIADTFHTDSHARWRSGELGAGSSSSAVLEKVVLAS